ncbi:MAG: hypothetical protein RBU37_15030 [Myxococcota bacterium]|jgi:hypothetical protein|nr:hypothetical protein [Myxococcota bacterium]
MTSSLREKWQQLQPRERLLLGIMMAVLPSLAIFVLVVIVSSKFDAMELEIEQYREALNTLEDGQFRYVENKRIKDAMRERLADTDLKVANFLSQTATTLGFDLNVTPKEGRSIVTPDGESVEETEFEIVINNALRDQFLEFIWQIDQSEAPIVIRRMDIRRSAGRTVQSTETQLSGSLSILAYRLEQSP